jgi:hypothetical protein
MTEENPKTERSAWPLLGYAPGGYCGRCVRCQSEIENVDKRTRNCIECVAREANELFEQRNLDALDLQRRVSVLESVREAAELLLEVHDALGKGTSASASRLRDALGAAR